VSETPPAATDPVAWLQRAAAELGVPIARPAAAALVAYVDALLALNASINLTAIRDRPSALALHALDSLAIGLVRLAPARVLDLGSGNGFPGVAVHLLYPDAAATLLDRTQKKAAAMARLLQQTGLDRGIEVAAFDAAQAPVPHRGRYDLVTARAVAPPLGTARAALPLLARGGRLALWLDADSPAPLALAGLRREALVPYRLPEPAPRERRIVVYRRIAS
jgi:16S rRNA (guanine527-N7)-methyltransferase